MRVAILTIVLGIMSASAIGYWLSLVEDANAIQQRADRLYGCTIKQQAPSGECP